MSDESNVRIWLSEQKFLELSAEGCQRWRRQFNTWSQQPKLLACEQWSGELEVEQGSRCRKSEVLGDLEGQQRRWTGQGTTVHSRWAPCTPGQQLWTWCAQEHAASESWWGGQRHGRSDASWKSAARLRWALTAVCRRHVREARRPIKAPLP